MGGGSARTASFGVNPNAMDKHMGKIKRPVHDFLGGDSMGGQESSGIIRLSDGD